MSHAKADIVDAISTNIELPKWKAADILESMLEIIKTSLADDEDVLISGFGKFCVNEKPERRGRDPQTGEDLMLAPRRVVTFKCSPRLKDRVNR